jgi:threonylcarbamoyladenosine tRNA methylthiotransferase CDKAL1
MKFYIETFGCTANFGNSQDAVDALQAMGHQPSSLEEADAVIVNTCAVTEKTERKILRRLRQLQGKRLILAGCLSAALPDSICQISCRKRLGLLNRSEAGKIADLFEDPVLAQFRICSQPPPLVSPAVRQDFCGIINIAEGCNGSCNYCIVRRARGKLVSRRQEEVVRAVEKLAISRIAEVQLAAQDTASYGIDIGTSLPELLKKVTEIPGSFMVRVGMMNPDTVRPILGGLIESFHSPKLYKFLHMPLQSGSDRVLKCMGRRYTAADFMKIAEAFRSYFPDLTLITDVIVGFPGETEDDFLQTADFIALLQPDKVNITRFSRRPGTVAAKWYDMPDRIKKDRSRFMTRLWLEIAAQKNHCYEGKVIDALVTERGRNGTKKARSANYTGVVFPGAPDLEGWRKIRIVKSNPFYLEGILLP